MGRKRGLRRFVEVLFSDFRGLVGLNLLFFACVLPSAAIFVVAIFGFYSEIALVVSLFAAFPVGGALTALMFCITKMLRDEPGFIFDDFKRKLKENIKQAAAPGILCAAFVYAKFYLWGPILLGGAGINVFWLIPGVGVLVVFGMVTPYIFLQMGHLDLKTKQIVINSLLISFANGGRSLMGALMGGAIWVACALLLPQSLVVVPILPVIGFSFSCLLTLMWVWPPVNKLFEIEKTLRERKELPLSQ